MRRKGCLFVLCFVFLIGIYFLLSCLFFRIEIPSESMLPTLKVKEQLLVQRHAKWKRGDILVFYSTEEQRYMVKRVIGLPGDTIEIKQGTVYINGTYYSEPYLEKTDTYTGEFQVPENSLFFLGDNREDSHDSRFFIHPYINQEEVAGKVILRIYPKLKKLNH